MPNLSGLATTTAAGGLAPTNPPPYVTVARYFQSIHLVQWWMSPTQRFGQNGEQGTDFGVPLNTPIGSPIAGTVVYSAYTGDASLGYVIQIQDAQGGLWHFQHMNSALARVGQNVAVGQNLGNSGGPPGQFSTGPHIEVRYSRTFNKALANGTGLGGAFWSDGQWIDSYPIITGVANGPVGSAPTAGGTTLGGFFQGLFSGLLGFAGTSTANLPNGPSVLLPKVHIAPTGDVTNFLVAIDASLELYNPFNVTNAQQDTILGATFTDPISWLEGFGYNLVGDLAATIWRLIFIVGGAYLCFKVANHFINFQALASGAVKTAGLAAMV